MSSRLDIRLNSYTPAVLSLFRVVFGLGILAHGTTEIFEWPGRRPPEWSQSYWWAGAIELVTGTLITVGFFTRFAAFISSGVTGVGYLTQHLPHGFWPIANYGEPAVQYCFAFMLLVFTGPGIFALESRWGQRGFGMKTFTWPAHSRE